MVTAATGHVSPRFQQHAENAVSNTHYPFGLAPGKLTIPEDHEGDDYIHDLWAAPDGQADLHVWLARPGEYSDDGSGRAHFYEVTSMMAGSCTVYEDGKDPVELKTGDTFVMQPFWSGTWIVHEYVEKAFVWVYVD
jgi:uncharacterized cupin superfamily protein